MKSDSSSFPVFVDGTSTAVSPAPITVAEKQNMDIEVIFKKSAKQLERDEGKQPKPYRDSLGIVTIGIGISLEDGLDEEEMQWLLRHRWTKTYEELLNRAPWIVNLDEVRVGALMNMAYNMGVPRLMGFQKMLASLAEGKWAEAGEHARNSIWSTQTTKRANRVINQFITGEWQ
jgi:lysozyme